MHFLLAAVASRKYTLNQPLDGWDTSRVASMAYTFGGVNSFDQPIGDRWDTSKVTTG